MIKSFFTMMNNDNKEERYELWKPHRNAIMNIIGKAAQESSAKETIIFGAGNCQDIDLNILAHLFDKIYLADIDEESMKEALERLDNDKKEKYVVIGDIEFTGLKELGFYDEYVNLLKEHAPVKKIKKLIIEHSLLSINNEMLKDYKSKFSLVISSAVYTQLCYWPCLNILSKYESSYTGKELQEIMLELSFMSVKRVEIYNDLIVSLSKNKGHILVWTDVLEITKHGKKVVAINASEEGLCDIINRFETDSCVLNRWIWPFSEEKQYNVNCVRGKIIK